MLGSAAGSRPPPAAAEPPAGPERPEPPSLPASRSGGRAAAGAHPGQLHLLAPGPRLPQPGCVSCDGSDVTVTASRTSFRGTASLRRLCWGCEGAGGASGAPCTGSGAYLSPCQVVTWQRALDLAKQRTALGSPDTSSTRPGGGE